MRVEMSNTILGGSLVAVSVLYTKHRLHFVLYSDSRCDQWIFAADIVQQNGEFTDNHSDELTDLLFFAIRDFTTEYELNVKL